MKILVVCVHFSVSSGRYIARALRRMGHDVKTTGPAPGRMIWGMEVEERWAWAPDFAWQAEEGVTAAPAADLLGQIEALSGWIPDLIITADSACTLVGSTPMPHVIWGVDSHVRDYYPQWKEYYLALFLAHSWGARMGEPNVHWLPPAYDPQAHRDLGLPERDLDVVLIGYPYPERVEILAQMRALGLNVHGSIGALWDAYNALYNRAKIALVRSFRGDLPQRFLENMSQGCCVLADRIVDVDKLGFAAGRDYARYEADEDAAPAARDLLATGAWREIAAAGRGAVVGHEWDARAAVLLRTVFGA